MGFPIESQEIHIALEEKQMTKFSNAKLAKYPCKFAHGQKWIFHKNWTPSLFSIYGPLTSSKKSEKIMSQFWEKTLKKRTS